MRFTLALLALCVHVRISDAQVTLYSNKPDWQANVGAYDTIDFTGFAQHTIITNQYSSQGVRFMDGADFIINDPLTYLNDGSGLRGGIPASIKIEFNQPIQWIAMDFPGILRLDLYDDDDVFYTSPELGGTGTGHFRGITSGISFAKVRIYNDSGGDASIDDLFFGPPIPGPSALGVLAVGAIVSARRRRAS